MLAKPIDPGVLERMISFGGQNLKNELIDMFLEKIPERSELILQGIQNRNAEQVERNAHSLISSTGNLGGLAVSRRYADLERVAMQSDFDQMAEINAKIAVDLAEFMDFLKQQRELT